MGELFLAFAGGGIGFARGGVGFACGSGGLYDLIFGGEAIVSGSPLDPLDASGIFRAFGFAVFAFGALAKFFFVRSVALGFGGYATMCAERRGAFVDTADEAVAVEDVIGGAGGGFGASDG